MAIDRFLKLKIAWENMSTGYSITLNMSNDTIEHLANANVSLCALKAVATSASGYPTVWLCSKSYNQTSTITWTEQYGVFTSNEFKIPNGTLDVSGGNDTNLGNNWEIDNGNTGELVVANPLKNPSVPMTVGIYNNTDNGDQPAIWAAGMSQRINGQMQPIYSCNLLPGFDVLFKPIEKVMLYFETRLVDAGTVVSEAYSDGLMIDMANSQSQTVTYDVYRGWSQNNGNAFEVISAPNVVSELITPI